MQLIPDHYRTIIMGISRDVTAAGSSAAYLGLLPLVAAVEVSIALRLATGYVLVMAICYGIKATFFKPRPDHGDVPSPRNRIEAIDASSFPSAHSARAAAIAGIIGSSTTTYLCLGLMLLALAVGASRVLLRRHTPIDVLAGWIIGVIAATAAGHLT